MTTIKKEKLKTKKYVLPETDLVPLNGRIFCDKILRLEEETESGLSLPVTWFMDDDDGNPTIEIAFNRFIVVAVANDVTLKVPVSKYGNHLRELEPGDEVLPQDNPDAIGWTLPVMKDFEQDRREYYVLHESEISGFCEPGEIFVQDHSVEDKEPKKPPNPLPAEN